MKRKAGTHAVSDPFYLASSTRTDGTGERSGGAAVARPEGLGSARALSKLLLPRAFYTVNGGPKQAEDAE